MPLYMQKRLATTLDIKYILPEMTIVPSAEYKKMKRLNRGMQFIAAARTQDKIDYLLYDITTSTTKEVREQIIKETKNKKNIIQHAIVITSDKTFEKQLKIVGVPELLVLPKHSIFIKLINEMAKGDFDKKVLSIAYPKLVENEVLNNKNIKYEINSEVYINMVLNNVSVFPYLKSINQLLMQTGSTINQIYNIVCLDIQAPYIKRKTNELNLNKIDIHIEPLSINQII